MDYKVTDTELVSVANAIRTKGGTQAQLEFPTGFVSAIGNISGGGGLLTGTTPPTGNDGTNGDLYKQTFKEPKSGINYVEYLQSNGTQYIDTEVECTQDIDVYILYHHLSGDSATFGVRTGGYSSTSNALYLNDASGSSGGKTQSAYDYGSVGARPSFTINNLIEFKTFTEKLGENNYTFYSTLNGLLLFNRKNQTAFTSNGSMILFGARLSGNIACSNAKYKRCVLFNKNNPIADYIPCLDPNSVPCMWENISEQYVYNDGSGDFQYGSSESFGALEPIYYIKKNGVWSVLREKMYV